MTDLEMTKLCAEAMELTHSWTDSVVYLGIGAWDLEVSKRYDPLHDDAQAMALVKRCGLSISGPSAKDTDRNNYVWCAFEARFNSEGFGQSSDLNRAIVECRAKMMLSKNGK